MGRHETTSGRPRIILHIGRNKAGSTSLQDFCLEERFTLNEQNVTYALFGHLSGSRLDVPGFATFENLRDHALAHPYETLVVSNEFMFGWPDEFTEAAAGVLTGFDVQVVAYIRSYDRWIVSAYVEETRKGMNLRNIDEYLEWMRPRISAWTYLRCWGRCFGWDAMRVRDLDPRSLCGGSLIPDFCSVLGVEAPQAASARRNASPHWLEVELARRLTASNGEVEWSGVSRSELEPLLAALRPLALETEPAPYLSLEERRRLIDLYNEDLTHIEAAGGGSLPRAAEPSAPARRAIPQFSDGPSGVLTAFFERTTGAAFAAAHPDAAARSRELAREMGYPRLR